MTKQLEQVTESLELLALSFEDQKRCLPEFADIPDDVTSTFENAFLILPSLIENNHLSNNATASLLRLFNQIQWCLRNVDLDDFSNNHWNKVREMAKESLVKIEQTKDEIKQI